MLWGARWACCREAFGCSTESQEGSEKNEKKKAGGTAQATGTTHHPVSIFLFTVSTSSFVIAGVFDEGSPSVSYRFFATCAVHSFGWRTTVARDMRTTPLELSLSKYRQDRLGRRTHAHLGALPHKHMHPTRSLDRETRGATQRRTGPRVQLLAVVLQSGSGKKGKPSVFPPKIGTVLKPLVCQQPAARSGGRCAALATSRTQKTCAFSATFVVLGVV